MRRFSLNRILAVALVACMLIPSTSAASWNSWGSSSKSSYSWGIDKLFDWLSGKNNSAAESSDTTLMLVEDETTVEPGTELRASTYAVVDAEAEAATASTYALRSADAGIATAASEAEGNLKYFPVTLFNYDQDTINTATAKAELEAEAGEQPDTTPEVTYTKVTQNPRWSSLAYTDVTNEATDYYWAETEAGPYYQTYVTRETTGSGWNTTTTYTLTANGNQIATGSNSYGRVSLTSGALYEVDSGSASGTWEGFYFGPDSSLGTSGTYENTTRNYSPWAYWTGFLTANGAYGGYNTNNSSRGNYVYMGLVEKEFANGNIKFTVPEGGVFDVADTENKDVYTGVGLPFAYDASTGYYTFDSAQDGAYFVGTPASNVNLQWNDSAQTVGGKTGFFPFNDSDNGDTQTADYHFGMVATIPFSMTSNGKMVENDASSADIQFSFSGDDDVWVFVDGKLVLDIGGIHGAVEGTINFAENTTSVGAASGAGYFTKGGSATSGNYTGKLFNDDNGTGILNTDRATFAAQPEHTLTVYYLERGENESNCKLKFNLPMKDIVSVQKVATHSKSDEGELALLDAREKTMVNNMNFGFTLYKNGAPMANASYNLYDENNQYMSTPSTDAEGKFTLKNGQTARFVTDIPNSDSADAYYVVEDQVTGFVAPEFTYSAACANGYSATASTADWTSMTVSGKGSEEAEDSIVFVCENFLSSNLPNPYAQVTDDQIVIDYGLEVEIENILANDIWKGDKVEVISITGAQYGEVTNWTADGYVSYQLTKPLSGVEVLTYEIKSTGSGNSGSSAMVETLNDTGYIYIMPATSMYYEEDFGDLVTYTGNWLTVGTAETDMQETGLVGDAYDSPYGSDKAYRTDGGDSNGSSKYVDTTSASASFSYTFSGTGTTFFARTTGDSGFMRVRVYDAATNTLLSTYYRETSYKDADGNLVDLTNDNGNVPADANVLYNIPVYTWNADGDAYGTYKMEVTIGKKTYATKDPTKLTYGDQFWLDGIRVIKPLDTTDANASKATSAYAADAEANMTVETLRDKLLNDGTVIGSDGIVTGWDGSTFVVFTDTEGQVLTASEYESNGPKEEVYLTNGQSITFTLEDWIRGTNKVFLGIKAPKGSGSVNVNTTELKIENAADCYYEISDYVTIQTVGSTQYGTFTITANSDLISLTNVKVTGNRSFTIIPTT